METTPTRSGAWTWALGGTAAVCLGALLAGARPAASASGRCVGMFLDSPGRGGALPSTIPADATNLAVRGTVPCRDQIMGWSPRGPRCPPAPRYRPVNGTVASSTPAFRCPK
jgi:hypothetical protein